MASAALNSLQTTICDLQNSSHISLSTVLRLAFAAVMSLRDAMEPLDHSSKRCSRMSVNSLDKKIKEAVWKFEDLLDSYAYYQIHLQSVHDRAIIVVNLEELIDDIESFTIMLEEFKFEYMEELDNLAPENDMDVGVVSSASDSSANDRELVGSSKILWSIRSDELGMNRSLDVISLVGMAGIGKTALAKEIFHDGDYQFDCRAWVAVGRKCQPHKLMRSILTQVDPHNERCRLKGTLKDKRCLVVLDDMWDTDIWDHFQRFFPARNFGKTLVLLTTRLLHVGRSGGAIMHTVQLLNDDESWDLLRRRVFGEEGECPPELEKTGQKIAQKCDGLPLMIITVADLLRQADEMTEDYWERVAEDKNSPIFITAYHLLSEVLHPSYEYLPQQLKHCLLYMGVFPQSLEIPTSGLLDRWIAEGFLLSCQNETIEACSEKYLRDLFDHSVIIICQKSMNYFATEVSREIKSCRLQSAFWHLCTREAWDSRFSHVLSTIHHVEHEMIHTQRRLSFQNSILLAIKKQSDFVGNVCASTARSLLLCGPYNPYSVPICFNLRLLKVLDAIGIRSYEFPILVFQLVYLRYLSLTYNGNLPASMSKLWNLQFLIIGTHMIIRHSRVTLYMPIEIWNMKKLNHLQVVGRNLPNPSSGASLKRLLKLKSVGVETCTKEVLERIPNLKKLGIRVDLHPGDEDDRKALHCLNHVHVLRKLISLKCSVWNPILGSMSVALPPPPPPFPMLPLSLRKLHLDGMGYPWSYMSVIGSLPHLQVLKLGCYAFRGSEWVVKDGQFQTLNVLAIYGTDLVRFKVEVGGFEDLRRLHLSNCYKLRDLQWEPKQSSPLTIEVDDCSTSTVAFANRYNLIRESHIPEVHRPKHVISSYMK